MSDTNEIFRLFKTLSDRDKGLVLKTLTSEVTADAVLIKDAPIISCPHCD